MISIHKRSEPNASSTPSAKVFNTWYKSNAWINAWCLGSINHSLRSRRPSVFKGEVQLRFRFPEAHDIRGTYFDCKHQSFQIASRDTLQASLDYCGAQRFEEEAIYNHQIDLSVLNEAGHAENRITQQI